ncbi:hypothetical protein K440DRAFT_644749 [Wilcoxina mikolae CBS 423.85]|nr:hypothetical protein K440DRAFT_644749 [Wilcoxina mikolae CBS 423.85]
MLVTILLIQQILDFSSQISAAPVYGWRLSLGNQTTLLHNSAPSWVPEPRYRGTWGILYSCTLTLVLCVYNSLHLNVSAENESRFSRYLRGIKWALTALVVPEAVLTFAVLQWCEAKLLCNELEELHFRAAEHSSHREQTSQRVVTCPSVKQSRRKPYNHLISPVFYLIHRVRFVSRSWVARWFSWTPTSRKSFPLEYGFYAGMGGFYVDTSRFPESNRVSVRGRMAITTCGMIVLARNGVFITLDSQTINNKSQVDVLAKALTIFQVSWMVFEASTLVHAFCALAMYLFWFNKPVGVQDPTLVCESAGNVLFSASAGETDPVNYKACEHSISDIDHLLTPRALNADNIAYYFQDSGTLVMWASAFIVFAAYGAVHLTAWNFDFPTQVEGYIWWVSCVVILVGSLPAPVWFGFADHFLGTGHTEDGIVRRAVNTCKDIHRGVLERFSVFRVQ